MQFGIGTDHFAFGLPFEWLCKDGSAVVIVEDHNVFVAVTGCDWEAACLVSVDFTGGFNRFNVDRVGPSFGPSSICSIRRNLLGFLFNQAPAGSIPLALSEFSNLVGFMFSRAPAVVVWRSSSEFLFSRVSDVD